MTDFLIPWAIPVLRTLSEIFTAAVAITAFSVLLFSLQFVRREKLARTFIPFMLCITIIYCADALETTTTSEVYRLYWQKIHWTGFILLPPIYYHFSDVLLTMTGMNSRLRQNLLTILMYLVSGIFIFLLWSGNLFDGMRNIPQIGTAMITSGRTWLFWIFFCTILLISIVNLIFAFTRTKTHTSRRRMAYLIVSSLLIILGTFPLLLFGSGLVISRYPVVFWLLSGLGNLLVMLMTLVSGYSVATFSVPWSDRFTRQRMIEWTLRGPMTASVTLGIVTLFNRSTNVLGLDMRGFNSLVTVVSVVLLEYLIMLLMPYLDRNSIAGYGHEDYALYKQLTGMIIFKPELDTFLEALVSALCDKFQTKGGFIAVSDNNGEIHQFVKTGQTEWVVKEDLQKQLQQPKSEGQTCYFSDKGVICPVIYDDNGQQTLLAIIGLTGDISQRMDEASIQVLEDAVEKARTVLWQRRYITNVSAALQQSGSSDPQRVIHEGSLLDQNAILTRGKDPEVEQISGWVKDALTHYWGGPYLSESPLMGLKVVRSELSGQADSPVNALRSVLKKAIERIRPEGERNYTGEWILYNILDLKFLEGQKVKDVARKLSMSEADFYRKQKIAIEEIAKTIVQMERDQDERKS